MNRMCLNCDCLGKSCKGTEYGVWTGCVYYKGIPQDNSYTPIVSLQDLKDKNVLVSKLPRYKSN